MSVNPPSHLCACTVDHCWAAWAILKYPNTVETANQLLTVKVLLYQGKLILYYSAKGLKLLLIKNFTLI